MDNAFHFIHCFTKERERGTLIWLFNIGTEKFWEPRNTKVTVTDREESILVNKMEEINLLLTRKQDYLILRKKPEQGFLDHMQQLGFDIPNMLFLKKDEPEKAISELVLADEAILDKLKSLSKHKEVFLVPYGISTIEEEIGRRCGLSMIGAPSALNKVINNKIHSRNIAEKLNFTVPSGIVCRSLTEIEAAYETLKRCTSKLIIKNSVGASGMGLYVVENDKTCKSTLLILKRIADKKQSQEWLVEEWHEKTCDINYQVYVSPGGKVTVFSIKEQIVDKTIYVGSIMPPRITKDIYEKYVDYGNKIGEHLYEQGFTGVLGVDSIISTEGIIMPIIEINARFTLSTYLSFLCYRFPHKMICTIYERVRLDQNMNYDMLQKFLREENMIFHSESGNGIFVYSAAALQQQENNRGRMFLIMVADDMEQIQSYKNKLAEFMNRSGQKVKSLKVLNETLMR